MNTKGKETTLEQLFNQKVLVETLGYSLYPGAEGSAWPKAQTSATGTSKEPDVMLGRFVHGEEPEFLAALELKPPNTGAVDRRGALRAERYLALAVSQPRFAQTSSVAAALFIV